MASFYVAARPAGRDQAQSAQRRAASADRPISSVPRPVRSGCRVPNGAPALTGFFTSGARRRPFSPPRLHAELQQWQALEQRVNAAPIPAVPGPDVLRVPLAPQLPSFLGAPDRALLASSPFLSGQNEAAAIQARLLHLQATVTSQVRSEPGPLRLARAPMLTCAVRAAPSAGRPTGRAVRPCPRGRSAHGGGA